LPWRDAVRDVSSVLEASGATAMEGNPMISESDAAVLGVLAADEARHIEDVIARCAMAPATVNATLMSLELAGRARQLEGQRLRRHLDGPGGRNLGLVAHEPFRQSTRAATVAIVRRMSAMRIAIITCRA
jgi:hypothetical protein